MWVPHIAKMADSGSSLHHILKHMHLLLVGANKWVKYSNNYLRKLYCVFHHQTISTPMKYHTSQALLVINMLKNNLRYWIICTCICFGFYFHDRKRTNINVKQIHIYEIQLNVTSTFVIIFIDCHHVHLIYWLKKAHVQVAYLHYVCFSYANINHFNIISFMPLLTSFNTHTKLVIVQPLC